MTRMKHESVQKCKNLDVMIASNIKFFQHSKDATDKIDIILGFINITFSFNNKTMIFLLYISLVRPHLQFAVQFGRLTLQMIKYN